MNGSCAVHQAPLSLLPAPDSVMSDVNWTPLLSIFLYKAQ